MDHITIFLIQQPLASAQAMLNRSVQQYAMEHGIPYRPCRLVHPQKGRPYLEPSCGMEVSITHSADYWACAVSTQPVGLDLQQKKNRNLSGIAGRFFHPDEAEFLKQGEHANFFAVWTAKEAYVKYTGEGISNEFGNFSVVQNGALADGVGDAQLRFYPVADDYTLCLCAKQIGEVTLRFCLGDAF